MAVLGAVTMGSGYSTDRVPPHLQALYQARHQGLAMSRIDEHVATGLRGKGYQPTRLCSDQVFVRRIYLDVIGTLPTIEEVETFEKSRAAGRRTKLIEELFEREEFADYWALKWCDILRVKAEFPANLWPNAVQAYHRWLKYAVSANLTYRQFSWELLTASGSNFRRPPVNFYRAAVNTKPESLAAAVSLTMMGTRWESWDEEQKKNLAHIFSRVGFKKTTEWKEEIVYLMPEPYEAMDITFPDGTKTTVPAGEDPREHFAKWLLTPQNPWYTKAICNRVWSWFMIRGIVHEPDDIRPDNPPINPPLLAYLQEEFVNGGYDMRHLFRLILNSRTYQASTIAKDYSPEAEALFAFYPVRRLNAEVLQDALNYIGGGGELYESAIPEPFSWIPETNRTIQLADGSITSPFLEGFGRPTRDAGLESERNNSMSDGQMRYMLNSTDVINTIRGSEKIKKLTTEFKDSPSKLIDQLYKLILSRSPVPNELNKAKNYFDKSGYTPEECSEDIAWALINSREFFCAH